jgi:hypothetical protein
MFSFIKKLKNRKKRHSSVIAAKSVEKDISQLITKQHALTPFQYVILWRWDKMNFVPYSKAGEFDQWENGILFGPAGQIQWRQFNSRFQLCLISDGKIVNDWEHRIEILPQLKEKPEYYYLVGKRDADTKSWFETGIPFAISDDTGYPVNDPDTAKNRVAIRIKAYSSKVESFLYTSQEESKVSAFRQTVPDQEIVIERCLEPEAL